MAVLTSPTAEVVMLSGFAALAVATKRRVLFTVPMSLFNPVLW